MGDSVIEGPTVPQSEVKKTGNEYGEGAEGPRVLERAEPGAGEVGEREDLSAISTGCLERSQEARRKCSKRGARTRAVIPSRDARRRKALCDQTKRLRSMITKTS